MPFRVRLGGNLLLCTLPFVAFAGAQQLQAGPKPAATPTALAPTNMAPDKLLAFAIAHNGLGEVIGTPWHVQATFEVQTAPFSGKFNSGTYEETWYAPQNYRRSYTYKGITHTDTATPDGLYRSGDQAWPAPEEIRVRKLLVRPVSTDPVPADVTLMVKPINLGQVSLPCLYTVHTASITGVAKKEADIAINTSPHLCFDPTAPILRLEAGIHDRDIVRYSRAKVLQGHIVSQDIEVLADRIRNQGSPPEADPTLRIHVQLAETIPSPTGPLAPPAGATLLKPPFNVPFDLLEPLPGGMREPIYPAGAIQEHLDGDIRLAVVVATDGTVTSATIIDGPLMLRESARQYVQQMKFKPFILGGVPVEIHTEPKITFDLGMAIRQRRQ